MLSKRGSGLRFFVETLLPPSFRLLGVCLRFGGRYALLSMSWTRNGGNWPKKTIKIGLLWTETYCVHAIRAAAVDTSQSLGAVTVLENEVLHVRWLVGKNVT